MHNRHKYYFCISNNLSFFLFAFQKKFRYEFDRKWGALLRRPPRQDPGAHDQNIPLTTTAGAMPLGANGQQYLNGLRRHQNGKELPALVRISSFNPELENS